MEQYEREFFVYRLIAGYYRYKVNGKNLKILTPSPDVLYEAQDLYVDTLENAREHEVATEKDIDMLMRDRGLWSDYDEDQLTNVLPKHVEYWKIEIHNRFGNVQERKQLEKHLAAARQGLQELFTRKHSFDHYSQHGVAMFARWQRVIELTTTHYDGKLYDFEDVNISNVLDFISKNALSEDNLREVVRNDPFQSMWRAAKRNGHLFGLPSTHLSEDQRRAINWCGLYDSVGEYPDCPSDAIFGHNDAFDGWLILKNRENEKNKREEAIKGRNKGSGAMDAPEVFLFPSNNGDSPWYTGGTQYDSTDQFKDTIYGMNDPTSRMIVNNRLQTVDQLGKAKDVDFADVQRGITRDIGKMTSERMKRR